nr:hypothetical protein [Tanacetum cinerariifolium]
ETASASTLEDEKMKITATIDGRIKTIIEASIRRHLKLEDSDGITTLPNAKIFKQLTLMGNTRRAFKGYNEVDIPLFSTMLVQGQIYQGVESTVLVDSHHTPTNAPSTSQPPTSTPSMQTTHDAEERVTMPHDSPLPRTKLTYGAAYTKLILRVKKLEHKVKTSQHRRTTRMVLSDDEKDLEDPSKKGRKIAEIDENPFIEPTELVEDLGSGKKGEKEISTVILEISIVIPEGGYKQIFFKGMSFKDIRPIFERVWDQIHAFVPMDYKIENEDDSSSKSVRESRKKIVSKKMIGAKLDEESAKRQKLKDVTKQEATAEYAKEKEEIRLSLKIIHNDDGKVNYEPLSKKFPIVLIDLVIHYEEAHVLFVNMLDGSFRMCIDYSELSKIDLYSGCHQMRVHEDEILKTAFRMRYGRYEFMAMPFWVYQYTSDFHGRNKLGVLVVFRQVVIMFNDGIEVYTKYKEENESHLKMNLELLKKEKCHVKPNKVKAKTLIIEETYAIKYYVRPGVNEAVARHEMHVSSIPDRDGMYIEVLERDVEVVRNTSRYEYCLSSIDWWSEHCMEEEKGLRKPNIVKRVKLIVEMKLLEFSVGGYVMMKVSPWKGVVRFGKKGELAPRYIRPFEIFKRIGPVAYRLRLLDELSIENYLSGVKILSKPKIALIL